MKNIARDGNFPLLFQVEFDSFYSKFLTPRSADFVIFQNNFQGFLEDINKVRESFFNTQDIGNVFR